MANLCDVQYALFFFLMTPRPPRSTLFPTRRSSDLLHQCLLGRPQRNQAQRNLAAGLSGLVRGAGDRSGEYEELTRSEEHASELQSRRDLVCRLLLEKKKIVQ